MQKRYLNAVQTMKAKIIYRLLIIKEIKNYPSKHLVEKSKHGSKILCVWFDSMHLSSRFVNHADADFEQIRLFGSG